VFPVKIPRNDNVGILKDEIKKKKAHLLSHIDASHLDLWIVNRPIDDPASKQPQAGTPLVVNKGLFLLWDGDPSDDDLHILVKAPPSTSKESWFLSPLISLEVIHKNDPTQLLLLNCIVLGEQQEEGVHCRN